MELERWPNGMMLLLSLSSISSFIGFIDRSLMQWLSFLIRDGLVDRDETTCFENMKASVSVIIRTVPHLSLEDLADEGNEDVSVEFLFIKRANRQGDRWSGHVGFPGGRHTGLESSFDTAVRETQEEIGVNLLSPNYYYCGRAQNATVRVSVPFLLGVFVFYQCSEEVPPMSLEPSEVASIRWCPLTTICHPKQPKDVPYPILGSNYFPYVIQRILKFIGVSHMYFPGLIIPPTFELEDNENHEYHLWGLTYYCIKQITSRALGEPKEQPLHFKCWPLDYMVSLTSKM